MSIGKPKFDTRPGVTAVTTARLWICATICIVQYWLLTASMEAYHGGNHRVAIPMFLASLFGFVLVAGLILTGEAGAQKLRDELKKDDQ